MKVVLTRDVKNTGRANEVVEVSDGHALNFLIPKRFAVAATPSALKNAESRKQLSDTRHEAEVKHVLERVATLKDEKLVIKKKANEQGHLYDGVDASAIADAAKLPEDVIDLEKSIKETGTFDIAVSLGDRKETFPLTIESE